MATDRPTRRLIHPVFDALADPIPQVLLDGMRQLQGARPPDEAEPPLDALRAAFPILVVSGGDRPVYEAICDALAERTDAERAVCPGMGHLVPTPVPRSTNCSKTSSTVPTGTRNRLRQ
ncbi:hypothetical protein AB0M12_00060 [Nocardia vinacea]|uniref:alpha/beta fold hydrolase n=1 Tax=Nocardia vinacea TaxID=96468 RepID=UPI00342588DB